MRGMLEKLSKYICVLALAAGVLAPLSVCAEPDFSDEDYWYDKCLSASQVTEADYTACQAYLKYMSEQSADLSKELEKIEAERDEIAKNISAYADQIKAYQEEIAGLGESMQVTAEKITAMEQAIEEVEAEIEEKQTEIDAQEAETAVLREKVDKRLTSVQPGMRINSMIDVLMGIKTFPDLLRLLIGYNATAQYDRFNMQALSEQLRQLNADRKELEEKQTALEKTRTELVAEEAQQ